MTRSDLLPRSLVIFGALIAALALAGCKHLPGRPGPYPEVMRPDELLDFNTLYSQNCSACHGAGGKHGVAVSLANPIYLAFIDDVNLRNVVANGVHGTAMPAFARSAGGMLTDQQIDVLVHEMRSQWGNPNALAGAKPPVYATSAAGDAARGAGVYQTFCASCHGSDGKGRGKIGSMVDASYLALISDQSLRTSVVVGMPDFGAPDWRNDLQGRPMTDEEINDVVAWLASQRTKFPGQPYPSNVAAAHGGTP
jgi:mono/diheme cytochrome c family protein